jgi:hypothetical protein
LGRQQGVIFRKTGEYPENFEIEENKIAVELWANRVDNLSTV